MGRRRVTSSISKPSMDTNRSHPTRSCVKSPESIKLAPIEKALRLYGEPEVEGKSHQQLLRVELKPQT